MLDPKLKERLIKLLRLAVNPGALDAEAMAAFSAVRKTGVTWEALVAVVADYSETNGEGPRKRPEWFDRKLNFGKHKGKHLGLIVKEDPDYMEWILDNARIGETLRRDIEEAVRWNWERKK